VLSVDVGSGASSSSESEVGCLQSGVCAKQKNVSSRDAYIAKEALELLVTCLQLRTPLLGEFCVSVCGRQAVPSCRLKPCVLRHVQK